MHLGDYQKKTRTVLKMSDLFVCFKLSCVSVNRDMQSGDHNVLSKSHGQSISYTCDEQNVSILNFSTVSMRQNI